MSIVTAALDSQDAEILAAVAALGPLIQTAITDIGGVTAATAADQAVLDAHVSKLQGAVTALGQLQSSLAAAEAPPAA